MPQSTANTYQEKSVAALAEARAIHEKCKAEGRAWTAEEQAAHDKAMADVKNYRSMAAGELDADKEQKILDQANEIVDRAIKPGSDSEQLPQFRYVSKVHMDKIVRAALTDAKRDEEFREYMRTGQPGQRMQETRAQQADLDAVGGYWLAPIQMVNMILKNVDDLVQIRQLATKFQVMNSSSLGVPQLEDDADEFEFTSELATGSDQDDLTFGKRELKPAPMAKRFKISNRLIQAAVMDVAAFCLGRLSVKSGYTQENAFCTGDGVNGPLGLFVASASGINTDRDVSTGNTTTALTFNGLKNAKWALKPQYRNSPSVRIMLHSDALLKLDLEKDLNGQYIWQPSTVAGNPDKVLNLPVLESRFVPNTFTASKYVGMIGDFQYYWIADALNMQVKVLNELYAEQNKTGYILRQELDAMPVLPEAFVRIQLAAS